SADKVQKIGQGEDSISGTIQFKGTMGNKEIQECQGKKGAFRVFDAYSSEKVDAEKFAFIWVHFIDFSEECPEWLVPRAKIEAEGALEFQVFNGKVSIGCRVESLAPWKKDNAKQ
ncbi:MAG: hypothetical protein IKW89_10235, partial [Bacteroidales bacterium]|nr:hypothetical protein [Bacteroidales bacterium]